jgi:2-aminoethylphosphonate-pyruvate transaminase
MTDTGRDPWLLTPGPLTTSRSVKEAMLHDWGSRDRNFIAINRQVRERLVALAGGEGTHVCVPLQGSGTFVVEATVGTLMPRDAKALILVNGSYGQRIAKICDYYQRRYTILETPENIPCSAADLDAALSADAALSHVFVIHCETTSGILNPVAEVAEVTARHGRKLIIDAMSAFGAVPLDAREVPFDAVVASSNKCIEGVPGVGFAIIRESLLKECKGNAPSLTLDLYDQWQTMEKTAQWRFTPPTHVIAAFEQALREHEEEGGVAGRGARYRRNCKILVDGMRELGFETLLPDALQAPIIVTFHTPADPSFVFQDFYDNLGERGFVIYPGKLTVADSFRIGCIGRLGDDEMRAALVAVRETLEQMGVTRCGPKESSPAVA